MKLYDLAGDKDDRRTSPYCWRTRLALAHKDILYGTVPVRRVEKDKIEFSGQGQVPVLVDGDTTISDSWRIAEYLEDNYTASSSLFGNFEGKLGVKFIVEWLDYTIHDVLFRILCLDSLRVSHTKDKQHFRAHWEHVQGQSLEKYGDGAASAHQLASFQLALEPMRRMLQDGDGMAAQLFLGGKEPNYADLAIAGNFLWARAVSPIKLLKSDDPVYAWRQRMFKKYSAVIQGTIGFDYE